VVTTGRKHVPLPWPNPMCNPMMRKDVAADPLAPFLILDLQNLGKFHQNRRRTRTEWNGVPLCAPTIQAWHKSGTLKSLHAKKAIAPHVHLARPRICQWS
jgi:hypothetical protein